MASPLAKAGTMYMSRICLALVASDVPSETRSKPPPRALGILMLVW